MPGWLLLAIFLFSLGLVAGGWWRILRLSYRLEKQRFGWSDEEARTKFFALRRPHGRAGKRRMQRYIREDLREYAEASGQTAQHRNARLMLAAGYAGASAAVLVWMLSVVFDG